MLLPIGKLLHENLSTTFTNIDDLLRDLGTERFTGYVHLSAWEYTGYLLMESGKVMQAFEIRHGQINSGQSLIEEVQAKAHEKEGVLSVHQLSQEAVFVLIAMMKREQVGESRSTKDASLSKIEDVLQEHEATSLIDLCFGNNFGEGSIFLHDGIPVECVIQSNSGKMLSGVQIYEKMINLSNQYETTFTVYRGDYEAAVSTDPSKGGE